MGPLHQGPFAWVGDAETTSYAVAGCLTLVAGVDRLSALRLVGADPTRESGDPAAFESDGFESIAGVDSLVGGRVGAILIEDNGVVGAEPEVLARLSKKGKAASVLWNVNGLVIFSCASRGKYICSVELPDEPDDLPRSLLPLIRAAASEQADLLGVAITMVSKFSGVSLDPVDDVVAPRRFNPIVEPVLGLPVTPDELVDLRLPSPAMTRAVLAAGTDACWGVAQWSARQAIVRAGIHEEPAVAEVLSRFGHSGPVALSLDISMLRSDITRRFNAAAVAGEQAHDGGDHNEFAALDGETKRWLDGVWAMSALAYVSQPDPVAAALGATYCATVQFERTDEDEFVARAMSALSGLA